MLATACFVVIVGGLAPLVHAAPHERQLSVLWTLVACGVAGVGYAIVRAIASLSRELGMLTTAEGVETQEQFDSLARIGCTEAQGYLFSPAVPMAKVPELMARIPARLRPRQNAQSALAG